MLSNIRLNKVSASISDVVEMIKAFQEGGALKGFLRVYIPLNGNEDTFSLFPLTVAANHSDIHIPFTVLRNPLIDGSYIEAEISYADMRFIITKAVTGEMFTTEQFLGYIKNGRPKLDIIRLI